jgi:acetyl-CoA acyltransferase
MPAIVAAAADAIQREIESQLSGASTYKSLQLEEKLSLFINTAATKMATGIGTDFAALRPYITDFVSCGASIYDAHHTMDAVKRASHLGLSGIEVHSVDLGGASIPAALEIARRLCESEARAVLIAGSEVPRSLTASSRYYREVNDALLHKELELHTQANLISLYALFADRLMFDHGLTQGQIDAITTFYRNQAQANPRAATCGKPLREGELKRFLAGPYATPMVAVATDHAVAILVVSDALLPKMQKDLALKLADEPLYIAGVGSNFCDKYVSRRRDFSTPARVAAERAFARSGVSPQNIDYAWIYDCFTLMLVKQAARYFNLDFKAVAETLAMGYIELNGKKIHVNQSGGILNTQAAISLSAATGLIDILDHAQKNPQARTFLFGGNGGLDTVNSVAILTRVPQASASGPPMISPEISPQQPARALSEGEVVTLYAAVMVRFNPGTDTPFALGAFRRADGSLCLLRIQDASGKGITETDSLTRDKTQAQIVYAENKPLAVLLA